MSLWEYKHITSGPHGFATPALLESYLNQLGKDEWEIVCFQPFPNNPLGFSGVARRTTLRDWTLESAAAAAAKAEADKLRAEFAAKFQGATAAPAAAEAQPEKPATLVTEVAAPEDGLRKLRDTERDSDPDAAEEGDDWDNWEDSEDALPTFFEAIKPHLRKNQRGPGQSVGITFLAKRWEQTEGDMINALKECGFTVPEREDDAPVYLEFEGELYWLNLNNRHELFLNTREKPRPVFRVAKAKPLDPADPAAGVLAEEAAAEAAEKAKREAERLAREAEQAARRAEHEARRAAAQAAREAAQAERAAAAAAASANGNAVAPGTDSTAPSSDSVSAPTGDSTAPANAPDSAVPAGPLPQGDALLAAIRPQMRRNRRGPGYSGSTTYLARAFKQSEADLVAAFAALGLHVPENANEKPVKTAIGGYVYWLNKDGRGGIWINGDEVRGQKNATPGANAPQGGDSTVAVQPSAEVSAPAEVASPAVAAVEASSLVEPVTPPAASVSVSADAAPAASEAAAALAPENTGDTVVPVVEAAPVAIATETPEAADAVTDAVEGDGDAEAAGEESAELAAEGAPEAARPKRARAPRKPAAKKKKAAEKDE